MVEASLGSGEYVEQKSVVIKLGGVVKDISGKNNPAYRHGNAAGKQSKEYRTWAYAKSRVKGKNEHGRIYYKDKGIKMHQEWFDSFENFLRDVGKAPSDEHSLDRIDPTGNYEPGNVRWATRVEQMNNTTANKHIKFQGKKMTQEQWGRYTGIGGTNICKRLKRGWSIEKALTTPKA